MRNNDPTKESTSFRLTSEAKRLLEAIAKKLGLTRAGVLESLIRNKAKRERIK